MTSREMKDPITLPREVTMREAVCDAAVEAGILLSNGGKGAARMPTADVERIDVFCQALHRSLAPAPQSVSGWIVGNANDDRWRAWEHGNPVWVEDRAKATRYARREDAEAVHAEDEDVWRVVPYAASAPQVGGDERLERIKARLSARSLGDEAFEKPMSWADADYLVSLVAALSQEAEPVAWRLVNGHGGETITREHPGEWPNHIVQRLIVHPDDRGGEVKG